MLASLRDKTGGIIAKLFIGLLAASFAVWGVADVFTGVNNAPIASVGSKEISFYDFRDRFDRQLRVLSQQIGRSVTPDQARQQGLDRIVLGDLLREAALEAQAIDLKLAISPRLVAQNVADSPEFQSTSGEFNRDSFLRLLQANGISEQQFVQSEQRRLARNAIVNSLESGFISPKVLADIAYEYTNEQREARFFTVKPDFSVLNDPSDSDLKSYYDQNQQQFLRPEFRAITMLEASPGTLANLVSLSEEDIKSEYEKRKDDFSKPESRTIEQITFPSAAEASAARQQIEAGTGFLKIAEERGLKPSDISLGSLTKAALPDPAIAEAAFALAKDEVSQPVTGRLSVALLRVTAIEEGTQEKLEDIRSAIEFLAKQERARDLVLDYYDQIEDSRAGGQALSDIAKQLNIELTVIDAVSRSGVDPAGDRVAALVPRPEVLEDAFGATSGAENDVISLRDDGYIWFEVTDITPPATPPLAEIRDTVREAWKRDKRTTLAEEKAKALVQEIKSGSSFNKIAEKEGAEVQIEVGLRRNATTTDFGSDAVAALFRIKDNGVTYVVSPDGSDAKIIRSVPTLTQTTDPNDPNYKALEQSLQASLRTGLTSEYMSDLQEFLGVDINDRQWERARNGHLGGT